MKAKSLILTASEVNGLLAGTQTQLRRPVKFPPTFKDQSGRYPLPPHLWKPTVVGGGKTFRFTREGRVPVSEEPAMWNDKGATCLSGPFGAAGTVLACKERGKDVHLSLVTIRSWVQRVKEISESDAIACGAITDTEQNIRKWGYDQTKRMAFADMWDAANPKHPWAGNPWVWAGEFRREQ